MSQDFFLLNRAHQISRLCNESKFEVVDAKLRVKLAKPLSDFYTLVERICVIVCGSSQDAAASGVQLSTSERNDLLTFEKLIVDNRFSADSQVKQPAVTLIRAIFADADYFSGLKPLPQYTDAFAYELLFPSWLNLLTALMLPRADNGKPRMSGTQQGALFAFLSRLTDLTDDEERQLTGCLTFIASRFDTQNCECLLQRTVDLIGLHGGETLAVLDRLDLASRDAREFTKRLAAYLTVKHSSHKWPATAENRIAQTRPAIRVLPKKLLSHLEELEATGEDWDTYFSIAEPLSQLIRSERLLAMEFTMLFEKYADRSTDLLAILIPDRDQVLCDEGQVCVAKLIEQQLRDDRTGSLDAVTAFARTLASSLEGFTESTLAYFCRQFIDDEKNRKPLLDCCGSSIKRKQMADYLLKKASTADDDRVFMNLLSCITVLTPEESVREARYALQAVDAVVSNRSIGSNEFSDLVTDLQANSESALEYLARPIMACSGKSARLASLYMTLSEITEVYQSTGKVGNFSVLRAKYSALASGD